MSDIITIEVDKNTGEILGYWTVKNFANVHKVTILTVKRWIYDNKINAIKVGGQLFIPYGTDRPKADPIIREGRHRL